jgi:hypothetical protein
MQRTKIKGTKVRSKTDPSTEPDFYGMPPVDSDEPLVPRTALEESKETSDDEEEVQEQRRSPSPSVVNTRAATQKLGSAFPHETVSSTVIPYESASSHTSDAYKSDVDDDDLVIIFEGRPFHYLDPYEAIRERPSEAPKPTLVPSHPHEHEQKMPCRKPEPEPRAQRQEDSNSAISEIDARIARLNEPGGIWSINVNSMDDESFRTLLENLVIHGSGRCTYSI